MSGTTSALRIPALAPSILTADFGRLREEIQLAEAAGVDLIHLDIMDGHFVPNISFGPLVVESVRSMTQLPLDVHLMIEQPERYIDAFIDSGADMLSFHMEATPHPHRILQQIRNQEADAGIALNPGTPLNAIEELLPGVDFVLVMSVNPGFGGQSFIPETLGKLRRLRNLLEAQGLSAVRIEVDGGIKADTIRDASLAGAEIFVCGSSIYNDRESVDEATATLRAALTD